MEMPDRERVIEWLKEISLRPCDFTTEDFGATQTEHLADDALALLREQEPVEPIKTPETIRAEYNCGKCTASVGIRFYDGDWYFKADYCPRCGRKVAWS